MTQPLILNSRPPQLRANVDPLEITDKRTLYAPLRRRPNQRNQNVETQ